MLVETRPVTSRIPSSCAMHAWRQCNVPAVANWPKNREAPTTPAALNAHLTGKEYNEASKQAYKKFVIDPAVAKTNGFAFAFEKIRADGRAALGTKRLSPARGHHDE